MSRFYSRVCSFFALAFIPALVQGQLVVDNTTNALAAVQNFLLGQGIQAFNITFSGSNDQIASFTCANCNLGIPSGVIMSTGNANNAAGPNNSDQTTTIYGGGMTDPDLDALSAVNINDAAILEFDFVPTGDSVVFNFVFASEEYPEYTNSNFNDSFGFFLSGPGINGPYQNQAANIALIPGTFVPLTINNLNNGPTGTGGPCEYCQYYIHNGTGSQFPYNSGNYYIQADGFTTVIEAASEVECGETYHIKLAIADGFDESWDSWVFLEAGSFSSNNLDLSFNQPGIAPSLNAVYEGCPGGSITLTRPAELIGDITFDMTITGTAVNGVDYELVPDQIFFPEGVNEVTIPFTGIADGITEGQETIVLEVQAPVACGSTVTLTLFIGELPLLNVVSNDLLLDCDEDGQINLGVSGGFGQYTIEWDNGFFGPTIQVPAEAATYSYVVSDICGVPDAVGQVEVALIQYNPIQVNIGPDISVDCLDLVQIGSDVSGGAGGYLYSWLVDGEEMGFAGSLEFPSGNGAEVQLIVTDYCGETGSDELTVTVIAEQPSVTLPESISANCLDLLTITPEVSGGAGGYLYTWTANGVPAGTDSELTVEAQDELSIELVVEDQCGGAGSDVVIVDVAPVAVLAELGGNPTVDCFEEIVLNPQVSGGVGSYSYEWTVEGISAGSGSTLTVEALDGLTVNLLVSDECGNTTSDEITVSVNPTPITINLPDMQNVVCLSNFILSPEVTGGTGDLQYEWSVGTTVLGTSPTLSFNTSGPVIISLEVSDVCGNMASDEISIQVNPAILSLSYTPDVRVCPGEDATLAVQVSGGIGGYLYDWSTGSSASTIIVSPANDQEYQVTVQDACGNQSSAELLVDVLIAVPELQAPDDASLCPGVYSGNLFIGGVEPLDISYNADSILYDSELGFYGTIEGPSGVVVEDFCGTTIQFVVDIASCNTIIPNIFSPNGDDENQNFEIEGIESFPNTELIVYNRWGAIVFEDSNYSNNWSGDELAEGTYFYILNRSDGESFSGYVTLVR